MGTTGLVLLGVGGFALFLVSMVVLHRVMEGRARAEARPERRRRLRAWTEARGGRYDEDVALPGEHAFERVTLTRDGVELEVTTHEARLSSFTRVVADDRFGRSRSGAAVRRLPPQERSLRRRLSPFELAFTASGDAVPDARTEALLLRSKEDATPGRQVLVWKGPTLVAELDGHLEPGPALDRLVELVVHVVSCQPDEAD